MQGGMVKVSRQNCWTSAQARSSPRVCHCAHACHGREVSRGSESSCDINSGLDLEDTRGWISFRTNQIWFGIQQTFQGHPINPLDKTEAQKRFQVLHEFLLGFEVISISYQKENKVTFTFVGSPCYRTAPMLGLYFPKLYTFCRAPSDRNISQCSNLVIRPYIGKDENLKET